MLKQHSPIDIAEWEPDPELPIFPQGARAKDAVFSPQQTSDPCITPNKRYLFKKSRKAYPDQFWMEVIAYRIGCIVGVPVPPAFAAWSSTTQDCGALIEWFYRDDEELSVLAGDLLTRIQPSFDRERGTTHNLRDAGVLLRAIFGALGTDREGTRWHQWWVNTLFFDALIGNTDRHQDNWALLFLRTTVWPLAQRIRIGPCFDNGTSLGHERFPERVQSWNAAAFAQYIDKGKHHIRWELDSPRQGHFELLRRVLAEWPETRPSCREMAAALSAETIEEALCDLRNLQLPVLLSPERYAFTLKLLGYRIARLKALLLT